MNNALLITAIGAGMVFLGLILLWFMMSILVKLTADKNTLPSDHEDTVEDKNLEAARRKKAAAAAAAAALALVNSTAGASSRNGTAAVSPWQAVHRSHQINQGNVITRRKRP